MNYFVKLKMEYRTVVCQPDCKCLVFLIVELSVEVLVFWRDIVVLEIIG